MSKRVSLSPGTNVTDTVVVCVSSRPLKNQKSDEGLKIPVRMLPEGEDTTVRFAVALLATDVFTNRAVPNALQNVSGSSCIAVDACCPRTFKGEEQLRDKIPKFAAGPDRRGHRTI